MIQENYGALVQMRQDQIVLLIKLKEFSMFMKYRIPSKQLFNGPQKKELWLKNKWEELE